MSDLAAATADNANGLLAVDWGTSSFRLSFVDADGKLQQQRVSERGIAQMPREQLLPFLREEIANLPARARGLPLIRCGMAGSNIGLRNVPYQGCPIDPQRLPPPWPLWKMPASMPS